MLKCSERSVIDEQLVAAVKQLKGKVGRTNVDLSNRTGVSESMWRALLTGQSDAGADTLAALVRYELDRPDLDLETIVESLDGLNVSCIHVEHILAQLPPITRLVLAKLISRGRTLAERNSPDLEAAA